MDPVEDGRMKVLPVQYVCWEEDKEGLELEKANAFFRDGSWVVSVCTCSLLLPAKQRPESSPPLPRCLEEWHAVAPRWRNTCVLGVPSFWHQCGRIDKISIYISNAQPQEPCNYLMMLFNDSALFKAHWGNLQSMSWLHVIQTIKQVN